MRLVIVTHGLSDHNRYLMPWRTVCEVADRWRIVGNVVEVVSLGVANRELGLFAREIKKDNDDFAGGFCRMVEELSPEVVFWPLTWRESKKRMEILAAVPVVGYFPGGYYFFPTVVYALKRMGLRASLPYMLELFYEKIRDARFFHRHGIKQAVTMSQLHKSMLCRAGWSADRVTYIPPGKDGEEDNAGVPAPGLPAEFIEWLGERNYILFMGPPAAIRGVFELLEAFELAAARQENLVLVCLLRDDAELDAEKIKSTLATMRYRERVYVVWQSVERAVLHAYLKGCRSVFLPFILVPSEIPLAIIETMACGKPVVTTGPSGTGEFVRQCGAVTALGDGGALADEMIRLVTDESYYQALCDASSAAYREHPTWGEVAERWLQVARQAVSLDQGSGG